MRTMAGGRRERRLFGRRTICEHGYIQAECGAAHPCIVVDISTGGARLQVNSKEFGATQFNLVVPGIDLTVLCKIVHQTTGQVGVKFLRSPRRLSWDATAR